MKLQTERRESKSYVFGNLTFEQAQRYQELIDEGRLDCEPGGNADVYFCGSTAVKAVREGELRKRGEQATAEIIWDYMVARHLAENGVQVIGADGAYLGKDGRCLYTMPTRDLTEYGDLTGQEKREARRQFREQVRHVRALGYNPGDVTLDHNSAFHKPSGKLLLFDFANYTWGGN